ncbi:MAG: putative molybdenum carrier protein [Planctomycetota bacterium]|nr:putative molybdenum carrier protein [Planctomycetota bacterium]MDA1180585.1 putative molybdenum carrier protein [Planctomycetota bacterium]
MRCIVSGGQTGVDRAALDVALKLNIAHGGWCPLGRRAEDGRIAGRYQLQETDERDYSVRTERNVIDSDATLILYRTKLSGGTEFTYRMTCKHHRPCLAVDLTRESNPQVVRDWLATQEIEVLNVAGPRERTSPGVYAMAERFLYQVFQHAPDPAEF